VRWPPCSEQAGPAERRSRHRQDHHGGQHAGLRCGFSVSLPPARPAPAFDRPSAMPGARGTKTILLPPRPFTGCCWDVPPTRWLVSGIALHSRPRRARHRRGVDVVGVALMEGVLRALPSSSQLVLVGDPDRLPPIALGAVWDRLHRSEADRPAGAQPTWPFGVFTGIAVPLPSWPDWSGSAGRRNCVTDFSTLVHRATATSVRCRERRGGCNSTRGSISHVRAGQSPERASGRGRTGGA